VGTDAHKEAAAREVVWAYDNTPEILVVDRQTGRGGWRGARRRVRVSGEQVMRSSMRAAEMRGGAVRVASHLLPTPPCHACTGIKCVNTKDAQMESRDVIASSCLLANKQTKQKSKTLLNS
jgi:hypothetical protein